MGKIEQQPIAGRVEDKTTFFYYTFRNILLIGLPLLVISGFILSISRSSAAGSSSNSDSLAITISSSCTLSSVVNTPHITEVYNGHYKDNIGKTTIKTLCNDGNGYSVYAVGYSNNEEGNNKLINSEYPQYSIDTGLATSGLTSTWAMKLNNIENDPSPTPPVIEQDYNNTYGIVPNYWAKVAGRTAGTTDMDEGSSFTTTYAVYASSNQHAGSYVGQVQYMLLHPSYEIPPYYMQDVDKWGNTLAMEESVQAIDKRDGKSYWVTKLQDGHIWMTQNLDFDLNSNITLNSNTTDLNEYNSSEYHDGYSVLSDIIYWRPADSAATINFTGTTVNNWQSSSTEPYSANKTDGLGTEHDSLGNYYNWTAAIASNNSSVMANYQAKNSICPKGWRLPIITNYSNNDFANLNQFYTNVLLSPLFFKKAGYITSQSQLDSVDSIGVYLSSNLSSGNNGIYGASITDNSLITNTIWVNDFSGRRGGDSIRCIARQED